MVSTLASSGEGDLVGNWSWTVWLLLGVVVVLAVITSLTLGGRDDEAPPPSSRGGGVSRYLDRSRGATSTTDREEQ
jgi:hypothetical protein